MQRLLRDMLVCQCFIPGAHFARVRQFFSSQWLQLRDADKADPAFRLTVASTVFAAVVAAAVVRRVSRPSKTVMDVLESDPDLSCFHGFWQSLPKDGPWEKPDLAKPRPKEDGAASQKRLVVFVPINNAWVKARQEVFAYPADVWRKLLISHVCESHLPQETLESIGQLDSLSGRHVSLDCIRNFYSDGSSQVRSAVCADNGIVYKIERVLAPPEGEGEGARAYGTAAAAPATGA